MQNPGASVVITHHILSDKLPLYEDWLNVIGPACRSFPGNIDWQIIRPIPNLTFTYTIITRFDSIANLKNWMDSPERQKLIEDAKPLLAGEDQYSIRSGLDFLFAHENTGTKVPVRWKQFLVTWSAILPLSILVPLLLSPLFVKLGISEVRLLTSLITSGIVVFIMVYFLMPNYTRLIKKWLYK